MGRRRGTHHDHPGLAKLAGRLGIEAEEEPIAAEAARRRLEQRGGWLLVFDNARDTAAVRPFLPQARTGWTLITSRHSAWGGVAHAETLGPLAPGPAAELLARRAGLGDTRSVDELVSRLDGLPLALEQAGAYLEATGMPVAEYVELFDARWGELLARGREPGRPTMVTVWELSFQELEEQAALAARLLTIAAFLAPDDIPRSVFGGADGLPVELEPLRDPLAYADAVAALARYSLVNQAVDGFSVHRLVQHATRERMTESDRREMSEWAVALLQSVLPYDVMLPATWPPTARLVPHAVRACEHARHFGADRAAVADLLRTIGSYLWRKADYREALALLELAVADAESAGARGRDVLFECLGVHGTLLAELGDVDGAQRRYERAIRIAESAYGPAAAQLSFPLKNLGSVLSDRGDLDAAQKAYERALAIDEASFGPDAAVVATDLNGLASVLTRRGDLDSAQAAFERALRIDMDVYGPDHPNVGVRLSNLASIRDRHRDHRGAVDLYRRALEIDEAAYGPDHPEVATDLGNLASPLIGLGDLEQARDLLERALAIRERVYGRDHPRVAMSLNELSSLHRERGDLAGARAAIERALAIDEQAHGSDHPSVAIRLNNLGMVAQESGDVDAARAAYERALRIAVAVWGPQHEGVAVLRDNLASL